MSISLAGYESKARAAVRHFWKSRTDARERQQARGTIDSGSRGAVTAGKSMDSFIDLVRSVVIANGLPSTTVFNCLEEDRASRNDTLPGYFRPTKNWDILVVHNGRLIAALEFKSQVGSYGNNLNNRCEEAIGTATDLWTAFREGAFADSPRPFLGYLMLLADCDEVHRGMHPRSTHFEVFAEFKGATFAQRYAILCRKLVQERLFSEAALLLSMEQHGRVRGAYTELSEATGLRRFIAGLAGHIASAAALTR